MARFVGSVSVFSIALKRSMFASMIQRIGHPLQRRKGDGRIARPIWSDASRDFGEKVG